MKKKIVGVLVMTLLVAAIVIPAAGTTNDDKTIREISGGYRDSVQKIIDACLITTGWSQQAKLTAADGEADDYFGVSVSIDGDYAIVGVYGDDNDNGIDAGSAYIFKRTGMTSWSQEAKLTAADGEADDYFGVSVSIDGDYAIVGAFGDDGYRGSAYIFKWTGIVWSQQEKIVAADGEADDYFGVSVSINGEYTIVGSYYDDNSNGNDTGSAYIFKRTGTVWSQEAKLTAADGEADDYFGVSVSIDEEYAIVGAFGDDGYRGSAYIFKWTGTTWSQQEKIVAADGEADDHFGVSTSISKDYVVIGAFYDDSETGSAYIFKRSGSCWSQEDKLVAWDDTSGDRFGCFVSISGLSAIIGAYYDDNNNGNGAGSAYIFNRLNGPPDPPDINGPASGKVRTSYSYSSSTTDPDGDSISYLFDWGDGTNSGWLGPYASGVIVNASHIWSNNGSYYIKVKALDELGSESDWSDPLSINMPQNKAINQVFFQLLEKLMQQFPLLARLLQFPIFNRLLNLR